MVFNVFSYYDPAVKQYSQPIITYLSAEDMVKQVSKMVVAGRLPEVEKTFLYVLGRFDADNGVLFPDLICLLDIEKDVVGVARAAGVVSGEDKDGDVNGNS